MQDFSDKHNAISSEGIAIVGMAFRFPGDLGDEHDFWSALKDGQDLVGKIPSDRWAVDELQHAKRSEPGRSITFSAGVLSRIDEFDAAFFGISPREAALLDPQQRLLLELAWEAMENSRLVPSSLAGSNCAVYVGISSLDYGTRGLDDLAAMSPHSMTGNTLSIAANRLSYVFDLRGPSLAVDTACSSSLVALHHACNCLRDGESSLAMVGGVNLLLHPYPFVGFTKASMLSANGRCKVFDASGDGYVRAEGGAVLLLKPLGKAVADGDEIHAVILASGTNADGARKTGITIPSVEGQAELMRSVLAKSGLASHDIDFVEAHGTGTTVGDPVEAAAIGTVYGHGRTKPLPIGSVKANIGHLESASGMAGLIKAVLAIKNRALPPALHLATPNPHIDLQNLNIELVTEYRELAKADEKLLVAGVNSFGFGGANAHVLLQEFRQPDASFSDSADIPRIPFFLSARTEVALRAQARLYADLLSDKSLQEFYDIAYAAAHHRERMEKRLALYASTPAAAASLLSSYAQGESVEQIIVEDSLPQAGSTAFVYSGNGSQWIGMGRTLMAESARFAGILTQLDAPMKALAGFSIIDELYADGEKSQLQDTAVAQPLLFAIQVAITTILKEEGIEPAAVAGHSVGEVAAAWAAGIFDLDQAMRLICARSQAQGLTRGTGRMAAVGLPEAAMISTMVELGCDSDIEISGINSPGNVTISGSLASLECLQAHLEPKGIFFRLLDLDYAFHSRQMDTIKDCLAESLSGLAPSPAGNIAFISTVTGNALEGSALDAGYWWLNVRQPVRFADAVAKMADLGCRTFIEIAPHAILQRYVGDCLTAANIKGRILMTLRKNDDGIKRLNETVLQAHLHGNKHNLSVYFQHPGRNVRLPNYPWQRERYWYPRTSEGMALIERRRVHPLLGWRLHDTEAGWENVIDTATLPWLADHKVGSAIVLPGSAYAEMALAAAREWLGSECLAFEELDIVAPLVFDGEHARTLRFSLNPRDGSFQIKSRQRLSEDAWILHAAGRVFEATGKQARRRLESIPEPERSIGRETHYRLAASLSLDYGPAFQGLAQARISGNRLEATLDMPEDLKHDRAYLIHPAVLDVCYQSLVDFFHNEIEAGQGVALLPVKAGRMELYRHTPITAFRARLQHRSARSVMADFELLDANGQLVASVSGCRFRAAPLGRREHSLVNNWRIIPWLRPHPADELTTELPSPQVLVQQLHTTLADSDPQRRAWFKEVLPLFEALTLSFAYEAFQAVAQENAYGLQQLADKAASYPYVHWLADLLQQENLLVGQNGEWKLLDGNELPSAQEIWQALLRDAPVCLPQLTLLGCIGRHLPELLTGEVDGRQFLHTLLRSPAAETLYNDDPAYVGMRLAAENILHQLVADLPAHRRLRVLEIAAGPSELPRKLLGALPEDRLDYVLVTTDEETCQRQQAELQEFGNATVECLNLADWKLATGLPLPGVFDVVILRHVLHRTATPHAALTQAKRWLARGGVLFLAERYPDWSANLLNGLDPAWWHKPATDETGQSGAPLSSLLSPEAWQQALREEGFDEVENFAETAAEGLAEGAYLLLAKRPLNDPVTLSAPEPSDWLLVADEASSSVAAHLQRLLESQAQKVTLADPEKAENFDSKGHIAFMIGWNQTPVDAADVVSTALCTVQSIASASGKLPHLWFITHGGALASPLPAACTPNPVQTALWGLGRVIMNEYSALNSTLIDLACDPNMPETLSRLENELLRPDGTSEILLTAKARYSLAMREDVSSTQGSPASNASRYRLDFHMPGQLRNLTWLPEAERPLKDNEVEVHTQAAGLNFRDVMYLMGLLPDEAVEKGFAGASLGLEFSGIVTRIGARVYDFQPGDAVMGFGSSCFASHVITRADAIAPMPEDWAFEAAATVPTVYFTVYYALKHLADLQAGERILIHGAAGGVGIAAIQLARHFGAEIFATAGNNEKRDFARLLGADHVLDSRSLTFADDILEITAGEGVDVVLNSLAGEAIRRNLRVLKPFGRFMELGKRDFFENTPIGLRPFKDNISYFGIDADQLLIGRPALAARLFREVMALFREGVLSPLPYRNFKAERVIDAFRVMQQSRHIGKVVVSMAEARPRTECPAEAALPVVLKKDSTWLITGGLSGFGLESARWLAERGAGNLVLIGRRGKNTPGAKEALEELEAKGVSVHAVACDITDVHALDTVIRRIQKTMQPIKGVLHAAMVIDDRLIANLDSQSIENVMRPKLLGAWNLHKLTLDIPLDHFVLYSSITTSIGNPGQANYVAANAGLEGLTEMRRIMGLPATCIGWGPIGDAGYLTRNKAVKDSLNQRLGKAPLSATDALAQLDQILVQDSGSCFVANFDWNVLSRLLPSAPSSRFAVLNRTLSGKASSEEEIDFSTLIAGKTADEITEIVRKLVTQEVAQILCIGADRIEPKRSLHDLGMDSLMAVELALGLEQRFGIQLPAMMLNEAPTIERVTGHIVAKVLGGEGEQPQSAASILVEGMARLHGESVSQEDIERTIEDTKALAQSGARLIA